MRSFLKSLGWKGFGECNQGWTITSLRVDGVDKAKDIFNGFKDELAECN